MKVQRCRKEQYGLFYSTVKNVCSEIRKNMNFKWIAFGIRTKFQCEIKYIDICMYVSKLRGVRNWIFSILLCRKIFFYKIRLRCTNG